MKISDKVGRLTILEFAEKVKGHQKIVCKCDCGNIVKIRLDSLLSGNTISCGCFRKEKSKENTFKHGERHTRLYRIWYSVKDRCLNSKCKAYKNYGARGICVNKKWEKNYVLFRNWALNSGYRDDLTIDRINNNGNYEPNNCRWADRTTQVRNRRNTLKFEYNGEKCTLAEICQHSGIPYKKMWEKIKYKQMDLDTILAKYKKV